MAIQRYAGDRITCLSGDTKPLNVADGAFLVETNTGKLFQKVGGAWTQIEGYSGFSGYSGQDGADGDSGYSGYSGQDGSDGDSGYSGYSGQDGSDGDSGYSGYSGQDGVDGDSGYSGYSGQDGADGDSGYSGYSGKDGIDGDSGYSGFSGYSGQDGADGDSGYSGYSGQDGADGDSGYSGYSGTPGDLYKTTSVTELTIATGAQVLVVGTGLAYSIGQEIVIAYDASNKMYCTVNSYNSGNGAMNATCDSVEGSGTHSAWTVNLDGAAGPKGDSGFSGYSGTSGYSGISGYSGFSGISGYSGYSGYSGMAGTQYVWKGEWNSGTAYVVNDCVQYSGSGYVSIQNGTNKNPATQTGYWDLLVEKGDSGYSGYSGQDGADGDSGYSGYSGQDGADGDSGYSGYSGQDGADGDSGYSGYSGQDGADGDSGYSGYSGISGYSGVGTSGYSGYSGMSGAGIQYWDRENAVGYSGTTKTITPSNVGDLVNLKGSPLQQTAAAAPDTPAGDAMRMYVVASGVSPNRVVKWCIKDEAGNEIVMTSVIV